MCIVYSYDDDTNYSCNDESRPIETFLCQKILNICQELELDWSSDNYTIFTEIIIKLIPSVRNIRITHWLFCKNQLQNSLQVKYFQFKVNVHCHITGIFQAVWNFNSHKYASPGGKFSIIRTYFIHYVNL